MANNAAQKVVRLRNEKFVINQPTAENHSHPQTGVESMRLQTTISVGK
jgi:hypothetical protein